MASKSPEPGGSSLPPLFDSQFASSIKESAAQIWQAGLGAFAKAQGEGSKVYESLVKEGVTIQRKTQAAAEEKLTEVSGKMSKLTEDVQTKAGQQWDRLEAIFEERVAKAMGRMGAPSRQDFVALNKRIDALEAQLAKQSKPATKSSAARPAVKKAAVKTAAKKAAPAKTATAKRAR